MKRVEQPMSIVIEKWTYSAAVAAKADAELLAKTPGQLQKDPRLVSAVVAAMVATDLDVAMWDRGPLVELATAAIDAVERFQNEAAALKGQKGRALIVDDPWAHEPADLRAAMSAMAPSGKPSTAP